jgi:hypothetical protein
MDRGYVKLWRKSLDSGFLQNPQLWAFWCWCLMKATHKPKKVMVGMQIVELGPGQFVFGRKAAAKELKISEQTIRTCVNKLKMFQNLTIKPTSKFSVISIVNWDTYQQETEKANHQTNQQLTINQPSTNHKQECKTQKNIYTSNFESFWSSYPKKIGKGEAFKAYKNIKEPRPSLKEIISSIQDQSETDQWKDKRFIPNPATWINGRRWEDEVVCPINGIDRKTPEQAQAEVREALT